MPLKLLHISLVLLVTLTLSTTAHAQFNTEPAAPGPVLSHAYPNPFTTSTSFELTLEKPQEVRVEVFNVLGQRVQTLHEGRLADDVTHQFSFEANNLPPGIYLYRATGDDFTLTRRAMRAP